MVDSNIKASEFIQKIELYYNNLLEKFYTTQEALKTTRLEAQQAIIKADEAEKKLRALQDNQIITEQSTVKSSENNILESLITITNDLQTDIDNTHTTQQEVLELQEKISHLENQNNSLEQQYQKTYQSLQKEMLKVDTMQMELELLQRERDIALRKQSLSPEQKQLLVKLEYENYRINETIERIDYISDTLKTIVGDTDENNTKNHTSETIHLKELQ